MRKFLSIVGLTGVLLFAGNAAYAAPVEDPAAPVQVEGMMPTATGKIIPLNSFDRDPVTGELDYRDTPPKFVDYPSTPAPAVAVAEAPAAVTPEPAVAPMAITAESVPVVPLEVAPEVPVTGCGDTTEPGVTVGDNAAGCDCPRGPSGECYSEAVSMPGYTEPVTAPVEPVAVPDTVETDVVTAEVPTPATEPVRAELAYTGAGEAILAGAGVVIVLVGVTMIRYGIRKRRA